PSSDQRAPIWTDVAGLGLLFGLLYFHGIGEVALVNPDEGRYAEVAREMVVTGDYVTPRLNGVLYFEKPPFVYWLMARSMKGFGSSEMAVRAVPAFFALAGVLITYGATRRLYGRGAGLAAAIVLGSSLLYFALGRILSLDMAVSVLMSATLFCFLQGVREPVSLATGENGTKRRCFFYGLYASAALTTLTKGLIGFLLPGAVMFFWLVIFDQWSRLRPLYLPSGVALFLAIAAPWHVLVAQRNPGWAHFYFVREHWERFTTTEHGRFQPWWYFLPFIAVGLFPWTGCVWDAVRQALRGGWTRRRENADAGFFVIWAGLVFLFFSISQSKLIPYILPVFPPLAVMIGASLADRWRREELAGTRLALGTFSAMAALLGVALIVVLTQPGLMADADKLALIKPDGLAAAVALLVGAVLVPLLVLRRQWGRAMAALVTSVAVFYLALGESQDKVARPGTKAFALRVMAEIQPGDRVYHYHDFFHDFTYYSEQTVGTVAAANTELEIWIDPEAQASGRFIDESEFRRQWAGETRLWVVARKREVVGKLFSDPTFHFNLLGETAGHYLFSNRP
ncbi:MAG TPA: glycosyltransferase family 39 protein, partial [Opitutus sp.]|nr:glycosyltransferase family 39 protein [Opitutus sp.]